MTQTSRLLMSCCALLVTACGAGDDRLDPGDLELRDLLGISPEVAGSWDPGQRVAARRVIEAGLHQIQAPPGHAALGKDPAFDRRVAQALAAVDVDRARHHAGALGVVDLAVGASGVVATPHAATLEPHATPPLDLQLRGWNTGSSPGPLPARGMAVLATLANDAGHRGGAIVVTPVPQLAVVAGYLPATTSAPARLVVNPVVLAALDPHDPGDPRDPATVERIQGPGPAAAPAGAATAAATATATAAANPYSFYGSVAECAAAQHERCDACLAHGSCTAITDLGDGNAECTQLAANGGRGDYLICVNLALAIDAVASCTAGGAPSCPRDPRASESIATLENNARFLDDTACARPLDACLAALYGPPRGGFPGPGSGGGGSPAPRNTSIDCGDSCSGDSNCDASPGCELDGPSCDLSYDPTCADSNEQSGCNDSGGGGGAGAGSCSGDSEDSCGSADNSACDSSDCGGGGDSSSCDGGGGGGCGGGGGGSCDGGGGGGDCGGGGGGGGGDCNVAGRRGRAGMSLPIAVVWALLPLPFAVIVRLRAERRRARAGFADGDPDAEADVTDIDDVVTRRNAPSSLRGAP
ncbi:MAG TPA: hypothetical protein VGD37_03925 [Kofleriaceae bacterium]